MVISASMIFPILCLRRGYFGATLFPYDGLTNEREVDMADNKVALQDETALKCKKVQERDKNTSREPVPPKTRTARTRSPRNVDTGLAKASVQAYNLSLGRKGEEAAARFLRRHGYEILERNWTCSAGEVDIIARDGAAVVFVEVKTRSHCDNGFPSEAVNDKKRKRYECIAAQFLQDFEAVDVSVRFDVVAIVVISPDRAMIRHHINAFYHE